MFACLTLGQIIVILIIITLKNKISEIDKSFANFAIQNNETWNNGIILALNDNVGVLVIPVIVAIIINILILFLLKIFDKIKTQNSKINKKQIIKLLYPLFRAAVFQIIVQIILLCFKYGFSRPRPYQTEYHKTDDDRGCYLNFIPPFTTRKQDNICDFSNIASFYSGHVELTYTMFLTAIMLFNDYNQLYTILFSGKIITEKSFKIVKIYNQVSIYISILFMITLTPLVMISRIIAFKHFWSDVTTSVVMNTFLLGLMQICKYQYQQEDFQQEKQQQLENITEQA